MRAALSATVLALALAAAASAQDATTPGAPGAEATVEAYARAFASGDRAGAAEYLDPAELETFVGLLRSLAALDDSGTFALDDDATPAQAFGQFLDAVTGAEPLMGEALGSLQARVVGSVPEGDSLRHVVVRSQFQLDGAEASAVALTTARWTGMHWVVTFDEKMRQFQRSIRAALPARGQ